ncbi:MAG: excalibur calcium-binding domain-containing protein [Arachnia sp.]
MPSRGLFSRDVGLRSDAVCREVPPAAVGSEILTARDVPVATVGETRETGGLLLTARCSALASSDDPFERCEKVARRDRQAAKKPLLRRAWVLPTATGLFGLFLGVGAATSGETTTAVPLAQTVVTMPAAPAPTVTVTMTPSPGPTVTVTPVPEPAPTVTVTSTPEPGPTVTVTATAEAKDTEIASLVGSPKTNPTKKASTPAAKRSAAAKKSATAKKTKKPAAKKTVKKTTSVYYKNCTAVRAAGADPIYRGEPGYSRKLDRDGDGIACE